MRSVSVLAAAVIIGATALTVACGQQRAGSPSGGAPASTAPATATASPASATPSAGRTVPSGAACGAATAIMGPGRTLTLSGADNSKSYCVKRGTGVLIYLRGTVTARWALLKSSSAALVPSANGRLMLALGVTGGYFVAAQPGTAVISSTRSPCGPSAFPPTTQGASGQAHCGVIESFRVTIVVA
ncbi:MAG TPA: hypothetical protein VIX86_19465 [Streptosporangiaceae bacterium]